MGTVTDATAYVHWGVIQLSVTNLLIIAAMIVVFVLALVLPFPGGHDEPTARPVPPARRQGDDDV